MYTEKSVQELIGGAVDARTGEIDYDLAIVLDAEDLAEQGIGSAYEGMKPLMRALGVEPTTLSERITEQPPYEYEVSLDSNSYLIFGPGIPEADSWGWATYAFFDIVNSQLDERHRRLFALNGGNDLFGIFMTDAEAMAARAALDRKSDWPYLPTAEPIWFGAPHD